jgi:hypothetical protein
LPGNHGAGLIRVYPDLESLSRAAAELFVREAQAARSARGRFSVALSGGGTPGRTYELLAAAPYREEVDWAGVHVFWGDERCVPWDDPRSNARAAYQAFLSRVPLPGDQLHPLDCTGNPEAAARRYEALLREFFGGGPPRLDLVFMGLGENGHTASLFPAPQPGGPGGLSGGGGGQGRGAQRSAAGRPRPGAAAGPAHPPREWRTALAGGSGGGGAVALSGSGPSQIPKMIQDPRESLIFNRKTG